VKSGIEDGDRVEILEPLREGDRVITTGAAALRDGDPLATASPVNRADRRGAPAAPATR
jgi:multidrug efflux pump subunit AcrA (membrane-fusion protein)